MISKYFEEIQSQQIVIFATLLVLILGILFSVVKNRNLPPGPIGVPLWGYWPFLAEDGLHLQLKELMKKYGDVYCFNIAGKRFIHIGNIKALKEVHINKADCFTMRFTGFSLMTILFNNALFALNGEKWKVQRKFFIQAFKEYGLTSLKDYMKSPIYESINATIDDLKAMNGKSFNLIPILKLRSSAILRRMMFNENEISCEEVEGLLEAFGEILPFITGKKILLIGSFAKYFMYPRLRGYKHAVENHKKMEYHLKNIIRRHEETYDKNNIRDMIDGYIKERNDRRDKGDPLADVFTEESLVSNLIQFVGDGILSIAIFIGYFIDGLLEYPEEQEKIYQEIIDVVGTDRQVTLEDRNKLPYTNAYMQEVLRTTDFFTIFPSLECTKETTLGGYKIPKGSITLLNLWACQRDPKEFEEPDKFKPSRYLNEPGKPKVENPVIFGIGRRSCAGESFTMMQVFLFLTIIVKNFQLSRPKGKAKKNFLEGNMEVCVSPRV